MHRNWWKDMRWLETTPTSPYSLQRKISDVLYNSYTCRVKVDTVNQETGEYRIILQGTLDIFPDEPTPYYGK
ncbi:MAG: hypothetical protein GF315_01170 [candidate division Zixibacteria bacterium]|nr:hypothetical protein [candidate division Zixibacteria bacterium]